MTTVEAGLGVAPAASRERSRLWSWTALALGAIALLAAGLNLWGLQRVGFGNAYYAAAVLSMLQNWHNFFFVAFDPGGFVSVDKPPLGFWIQAASARLLGFSGVAILLPEALAGIGSVLLTYHLVKRAFGTGTGLLAALMLALTPVSVAVSRNNTIDSLLVFTLLLAAWATFKAAEGGSLMWLLLAALTVGLGFEIKMLEAYLVVPALGLLYLVAAPRSWLVRVGHLALAGVVLLTVSFAWPVAVDLTPASQRPWVDSTQDNSAVNLALGYNGIQRLLGRGATLTPVVPGSSGAGAQAFAGFGGPGGRQENGAPGPLRLIDQQLGPQASWLLSLSLAGLVISGLAAWRSRRTLSTSRRGQAFFVWGTWLLTAGVFFSVAEYFHSYYLVTLGPPVGALAAIGTVGGWRALRDDTRLVWLLPLGLLAGGVLEGRLLVPYSDGAYSWLAPLALSVSVLSAVALIGVWIVRRWTDARGLRSLGAAAAGVGVVALLVAPAVWAATPALGQGGGGLLPSAVGPRAGLGPGVGFARGGASDPGVRGGPGGVLGLRGGGNEQQLIDYLEANQGSSEFLVATSNANAAAPIVLETGKPVMALGGFLGSDPILSAQRFASLVQAGEVRFVMASGRGFGFGGFGGNSSVMGWVQHNCAQVDGGQLYDCAASG